MSRAAIRRPAPTTRPRLAVTALEDRIALSGIPSQWLVRGAGGGGSIYSPQFNPTNANDIYVGSDVSQVFHTADAGASWQTLDFRQIQGGRTRRCQNRIRAGASRAERPGCVRAFT